MTEEVYNPYPKWIDHPTDSVGTTKDGKRIPVRFIVQDAKEEAVYYPKKKAWADPAKTE